MVFLLEARRLPLHSRAPDLGHGASPCTKGLSPDGASDSICQGPLGSQIGSDSSDGSRSPKMLGGMIVPAVLEERLISPGEATISGNRSPNLARCV